MWGGCNRWVVVRPARSPSGPRGHRPGVGTTSDLRADEGRALVNTGTVQQDTVTILL